MIMGTCMCVYLTGFRHKDDASDKKILRVLYKPYKFVADGGRRVIIAVNI